MTDLDKILSSNVDRRTVLKTLGLVGAGLATGCAALNSNKDWSQVLPEKFHIKAFDRWFRWNKLYNGRNPNLDGRRHSGGYHSTFKSSVFSSGGATPGTDYRVPSGEVMVACAPGRVSGRNNLFYTGRVGGWVINVDHYCGLTTLYAHLNKVFVEYGQEVERGEPIGNVTQHTNHAKLMLHESGYNLADPDNYGLGYGYMDYQANHEKSTLQDDLTQEQKLDKCRKHKMSFKKLVGFISDEKLLDTKFHRLGDSGFCKWSMVEQFRYCEELYKAKPSLFPNLSQEEFQSLRKDFYANQPIVLTLPFVKGGMRR